MRTRNYIIVVNNYKEYDREKILGLECIKYCILGYEKGEKKETPHIQGYIQFKNAKTTTAVHKILKTIGVKAALIHAKGSVKQNRVYCSKDGDFKEKGVPSKQGRRTDIEEMYKLVELGKSNVEIQEQMPGTYMKYHKAVDKVRDNLTEHINKQQLIKDMESTKLRIWQRNLLKDMETQNNRQIHWVVDLKGNKGKTYLAKYLIANRSAYYVRGGKASDITYGYNYEDLVIFDFTRDQCDRINYNLIEQFKDGLLFSPKYESKIKIKTDIKVLILSNFEPDLKALSKDRWVIWDL